MIGIDFGSGDVGTVSLIQNGKVIQMSEQSGSREYLESLLKQMEADVAGNESLGASLDRTLRRACDVRLEAERERFMGVRDYCVLNRKLSLRGAVGLVQDGEWTQEQAEKATAEVQLMAKAELEALLAQELNATMSLLTLGRPTNEELIRSVEPAAQKVLDSYDGHLGYTHPRKAIAYFHPTRKQLFMATSEMVAKGELPAGFVPALEALRRD